MQELGSYKLQEEIGKGGMATVFRAHQPSIDRDVAIKLIKKNIADSPDAVQRFQREAQLIARLEHPHILPVYDFDGRHDPPYIVMRYLEGGTLKEVMQQGRLPLAEVVYLMQQVCGAVDYANRQGIIHRDLKPSNILVDREGNAFVMDFGIARMAGNSGEGGITATGAVIGTPDYMSPEQAMGDTDIDHRTDIYALGVMLYEMLTGRLPYKNETPMAVLLMHMHDPVPSAVEYNPDLPDGIDNVINRVLAKNKDDRYASAAELYSAIIENMGGTITHAPIQLREAAGTSIIRRIGGDKSETGTGSSTGASEQNKTVTALYASAKEYVLLIEEIASNEAATKAVNALMKEFAALVDEAGGQVFSQSDTEMLALWGAENALETDAEQAIRTALAMQEKLKVLGAAFLADDDEDDPLPLNIGINSGIALLKPNEGESTYSASGASVTIASRLMDYALGSILITHDTFRQVMGIFDIDENAPIKMRGRKEPIQSYLVKRAKPRAFHIQLRGIEGIETQMVGRRAEFETLQQAYLDAVEDEETQVITLISDAGFGKSRMLYEFDKWAELREETYRIFNGRATSTTRDRAYALIRDMMSFRFDIQDSDELDVVQEKLETGVEDLLQKRDTEMAHMIGYLCGFDLSHSPHIKGLLDDAPQLIQRAKQLFIRLFTTLAGEIQPVMVTLEDIHYADDASLDLLNELFVEDDELKLIIVCTARPSLLERRSTWGSGQDFHTQLKLQPLKKREARDLVKELLQKVADIPKELRDLLVERSEGNPYFMEELVKMMLDERVIMQLSDAEWQVEMDRLGALEVPKTLNGLLESRLDTLLSPEKLTLQRASVIGRIFYDTALLAIEEADEGHVSNLDEVLHTLVERQFIYERETSAFEGATEYIFASNMLRDAIENALLERQVTTYNHATAEWLIETAGNRKHEYTGLIADYYEKAGEKIEAADYLIQAADNAFYVGAQGEAQSAYNRALELLPEDAIKQQAQVLLGLGNIQYITGDIETGRKNAEMALALAKDINDNVVQAKALYSLAQDHQNLGNYNKMWEFLGEAVPLAEDDPDTLIATKVLQAWHLVFHQGGKYDEAKIVASEILEIAREKLPSRLDRALNIHGVIALNTGDLEEGRDYLEQMREFAQANGNRSALSTATGNLGEIARMQGKYDEARSLYQQGLEIVTELGTKNAIGLQHANIGLVEVAVHDIEAAKRQAILTIQASKEVESIGHVLYGVLIWAGALLLEGDTEQGLALLGLVKNHPVSDGNVEIDMKEMLLTLPNEFTEEELEAGMAAGKDLDLDVVAEEILSNA